MDEQYAVVIEQRNARLNRVPLASPAPAPSIAEPNRRKDVQRSIDGGPVVDGKLNQDVVRPSFRVLNEQVEVLIVVEHAGVNELELTFVAAAPPVLIDELAVRELALRVLVESSHVRVSRS